MPLSEHEQRVLEQMEQALYAEDPRFAHQMVGQDQARARRRRTALGVLLVLAGLGLVVLAVLIQQIWVGGIGFGAMVLGGVWAFAPRSAQQSIPHLRVAGSEDAPRAAARTAHPSMGRGGKGRARGRARGTGKGSGTFLQRMEQRWERRREQGPGS